jgi:hypothetical protein
MSLNKAVLCACMLLLSLPAPARRTDWRQMIVGHFQLYSTLRDSRTREVARQLQSFEQTAGEILQSEDRLPDVPTLIYILNGPDFVRYGAGRMGLAGVFYERPFANVIVINGDLPFDVVRVTVFHEYTHFVQRNSYSAKMPPWFVEGYAELFSGFKLKGNTVTIGELPVGVGIDMQHWIPVERILAVKQSDAEYRAERLAPQFYGESWALVHLLMFDDKSLLRPTSTYLRSLDVGIPEPEAFAQAFPFDKNGLDQAVQKLIEHKIIHVKVLTLPRALEVDEAPISSMSPTQADASILRLSLILGWYREIAVLATEVLKDSPSDPALRALCARVKAAGEVPLDISDLSRTLANGGTNDPSLRVDVAATLLGQSQSKESSDQALAILEDLVHGDAAPLEGVALWAKAAARSEIDPATLLTTLEKNSARAPHNTQLLADLARSHETLGNKAKARDYYDRIILVSDYPEERLWAQKQADSRRLREN